MKRMAVSLAALVIFFVLGIAIDTYAQEQPEKRLCTKMGCSPSPYRVFLHLGRGLADGTV
jgi:hypothetical protein